MVTTAGTPLALVTKPERTPLIDGHQLTLKMKATMKPGETIKEWANRHEDWLRENARYADEKGFLIPKEG